MDQEQPQKSNRLRPPQLERSAREYASPTGISEVDVPGEIILNSDPLTIDLIVENILSNLNGEDLESCKKVNRLWKSVVGQLHSRHYAVTFESVPTWQDNEVIGKQNHVTVRKIYWSSRHSPLKKYTVSEALEILLKKSLKKRKFALELNLSCIVPREYDADTFRDFASKVGHLVHTFSSSAIYETFATFCTTLRGFPNLHHLDLTPTRFDDSGTPLGSSLNEQESLLKNVKKITFGSGFEHPEDMESLLELIPNLEEIHEFPVLQVDALISKGKSNLVMSIDSSVNVRAHELDEMEEEIEDSDILRTSLEKFAQLAPRLRSFSFGSGGDIGNYRGEIEGEDEDEDEVYYWPKNLLYHPTLQSSVRKILESSHKSLEAMTISPPGNFDFSGISPMTSLKKIELVDLDYLQLNEIPKYLRPQIRELVLDDLENVDCERIRELGNAFGTVKHFEFRYVLDHLEPILPIIADLWPEMEVMIMKFEESWDSAQTFDSFFTGIPDDILTQLKYPTGRDKFTGKEMAAFYKNSTIRKLAKLKKLELDVGNLNVGIEDFVNKMLTITSLSKEFGFDFMSPAFELVFRNLPLCCIPDLKEALSDVVRFEI